MFWLGEDVSRATSIKSDRPSVHKKILVRSCMVVINFLGHVVASACKLDWPSEN